MPNNINELNVRAFNNINDGLKDVDAILMLRIQKERMSKDTIPSENEYFKAYGLNEERLKFAKNDCIVLHPGPINRGVEIDALVADGRQSVILEQVKNGIGIRMAVMEKMTN
jgi:aspartate carbamoyltransferase catalytic subunit